MTFEQFIDEILAIYKSAKDIKYDEAAAGVEKHKNGILKEAFDKGHSPKETAQDFALFLIMEAFGGAFGGKKK